LNCPEEKRNCYERWLRAEIGRSSIFWIGSSSSQDEYGTAAYKTVELDEVLGGAPVEHREVQGSESDLFHSYFVSRGGILYLDGGAASGFHHVEKKETKRLLEVKGTRMNVRTIEVSLECSSLNEGDVFVLETNEKIYLWFGKSSAKTEQTHAWALARALKDDHGGRATIIEIYQDAAEQGEMFSLLAGEESDIGDAASAGDDAEAAKSAVRKLFRVSDAKGQPSFTPIAEGGAVKRSLLDGKDVFVLDTGYEVFVWVGRTASMTEKKMALPLAQEFLQKSGRPAHLPLTRVTEGVESSAFNEAFV